MTRQKLNENIAQIREKMAAAERAAGRAPGSVKLCAASKTQDADTVRLSAELEIDLFGENRVQELVEKHAAGAYLEKPLHFIGHLQTNKVRQVVGVARVIQSVDSARLLAAVEKEAAKKGLVQDIFLEVNIGGEDSKSGVAPDGLDALAELCAAQAHIRVLGLMTIPPVLESNEQNRRYFAQMRRLACRVNEYGYANVRADELSMGMSADYENAILEGATIVRVGTAIYGARDYSGR